MVVFFINAPVQIFDRVLPFIIEKNIKDPTFVVVKELAPFFKEYFPDSKIITPEVHPNLITQETKFNLLQETIRTKKEFKSLFKDMRNELVYVCFGSWSIAYMYFAKMLNEKNGCELKFLRDNTSSGSWNGKEVFPEGKGFVTVLMNLFADKALGIPTFVLMKGGVPTWEFEIEKIGKIEYFTPSMSNGEIANKLGVSNHIKIPEDSEILFVGDDVVEEGAVYDSVVSCTNGLMDLLDKKYPKKYAIKPHPRETVLYGRMEDSETIIEPTILSDTLMMYPWKYVIGYYSDALRISSVYGHKSISMLHLFEWTNETLKEYWIDKFNKLGVLMPKTMNELEEMLNG